MNYEHKELIRDYLNLDKHIQRVHERMKHKELEFNAQSFCGGTVFHPLGISYKNFNIENRVCNYVDLMNTYQKQIEMNKRRSHYFNRFLSSLSPHTRVSLNRRYKKMESFEGIQELGHDEIVLDEILEIEEAIAFEFNINLSNELQRQAIQVEYTAFSDDTVEDSFEIMQSLLGV